MFCCSSGPECHSCYVAVVVAVAVVVVVAVAVVVVAVAVVVVVVVVAVAVVVVVAVVVAASLPQCQNHNVVDRLVVMPFCFKSIVCTVAARVVAAVVADCL